MNRWAPIDPEDALELLGPNFTYPTVRKYAVSRLSHAPDEVLRAQSIIRRSNCNLLILCVCVCDVIGFAVVSTSVGSSAQV